MLWKFARPHTPSPRRLRISSRFTLYCTPGSVLHGHDTVFSWAVNTIGIPCTIPAPLWQLFVVCIVLQLCSIAQLCSVVLPWYWMCLQPLSLERCPGSLPWMISMAKLVTVPKTSFLPLPA